MDEVYTEEVRDRDAERSRELLAKLPPDLKWFAAELMTISHRSGVQAGLKRNSAMLLLL